MTSEDGQSQLMLFASGHLERARELEEFRGSFLTHEIINVLSSPTSHGVLLLDLVNELKRRASIYNERGVNPVPIPYLFGELRSPFLIKKPKAHTPVVIRYRSLYEPDLELLAATLFEYEHWAPVNIRHHLPVSVELAESVLDRLRVLRGYVESDQWPCEVSEDTKTEVREAAEEVPVRLRGQITEAVRILAASARSPDGSGFDASCVKTLATYLPSKALAFARLLMAMRLNNEPPAEWMPPLFPLADSWWSDVLSGLTVVAHKRDWLFWTDADFDFGSERLRVYVPQTVGAGVRELQGHTKDELLGYLLPQVLEKPETEFRAGVIRTLLARDAREMWHGLHVRGEQFISTDVHNFPDASIARKRALRRVAEHFAKHLTNVPADDRERVLLDEVGKSHVFEYWEVRDALSALNCAGFSVGPNPIEGGNGLHPSS